MVEIEANLCTNAETIEIDIELDCKVSKICIRALEEE